MWGLAGNRLDKRLRTRASKIGVPNTTPTTTVGLQNPEPGWGVEFSVAADEPRALLSGFN